MAGASDDALPELLEKMKSSHAELQRKLKLDSNTVVNLHYIARHAADYAERIANCVVPATEEKPPAPPQPKPQAPQAPAQPAPPQPLPGPPAVQPPAPPAPEPSAAQAPAPPAPEPMDTDAGAPGDIVVVGNLPVGWGTERVGLFLTKLKLKPASVAKAPNSTTATLTFPDGAGLQQALRLLPRQQVLGNYLAARLRVQAQPDTALNTTDNTQRGQKRKGEAGAQQPLSKKPNTGLKAGDKEEPGQRDIRDTVCPWWNRPYHEQLEDKAWEVAHQLYNVTREVIHATKADARPQWAKERAGGQRHGGRCAPLLGIIRSPQLEGYRNKSEFTIGRDAEGQLTVGFQLGLFREGFTAVAAAHQCRHISPTALAYADMLTLFLRAHPALKPWDKKQGSGFWRLLTVREGRAATFLPPTGCTDAAAAVAPPFAELDPLKWLVDISGDRLKGFPVGQPVAQVAEQEPTPRVPEEVLVMVQVHPMGAPDRGLMESELKALESFFREEEARQGRPPAVIVLQHHTGVSNAAGADAPLLPFPSDDPAAPEPAHVHDTLCDLKFRISPTAFFQVNSPTACLLYRLAGQWVGAGPQTLLLDICCGTGTIGLTLARGVAKVVGVDIIESAIHDARANAELNGISNCEFIAGKAEEVLPRVLSEQASKYANVAAVVDPPRAGLHKNVLRNLLACSQIKRLVYVSCNPTTLGENLTTLCMPPRYGEKHTPFTPLQAVAVDLFPHTRHVEGVVLLQR